MAEKGYPLSGRVRKEKIPEKVIFTDTETITLPGGQMQLVLGCYEVWAVDWDGLPDCLITKGTYRQESGFYEMLVKHLDCRVIAHNWQFDAAILRLGARENLNTYGYDIDVDNGIFPVGQDSYAPFLVRLKFDHGFAEFVCNTNYYKTTLENLGKSVGIPKLEMPEEIADDVTTERYCQQDVAILRESYFKLFAFTRDIANTTPGITAAMAANRIFRSRYYHKTRVSVQGTQHIPFINDSERAAYHGGRTDTFFKGKPSGETVYKYDVNSLYPSCMLGSVPIRYNQSVRPDLLEKVMDSGYHIALTKVTLHIPPESRYGFLGLEGIKDSDTGQLIFPVGRFDCWIWQPLLEIALEQGYVETVHNVLIYDIQDLFSEFVGDLYALRSEYKAAGNYAYDMTTKLILNSLYGKFAQRKPNQWVEIEIGTPEYDVMIMSDTGEMQRFNGEYVAGEEKAYWQLGQRLYGADLQTERQLSRSAVCSVAGFITAKARAVLWRALAAVLDLGGELYFCDTDSVVSNVPLPASLVHETELGKFKNEGIVSGDDCYFYAPKHYYMDGILKLKGVRNPTMESEHPQDIFPNFMTDLLSTNPVRRARLETGGYMRSVVKRPTGENRKRIEQGEGLPTLPIVMY